MAKFYPALSIIRDLKPAPTEGEWKLLEFLAENYNDEYEVFFQPFLNEARPDVVIMRKGGGVMIVEVKDWDLSNYKSTPTGTWIVKADNSRINYTPIRQVVSYKEKLYSLNSWELFSQRTLSDSKSSGLCWGLVNCAVFFHKSTEAQVRALCYPPDITQQNKKFLGYIELLGDDSLTKQKIDGIFCKKYISGKSKFFDDAIYDELFRLFKPDFHTIEQGVKYDLTPVQEELSRSFDGARKRIKGVAGSGKSFVLARRAVNAHKRTGGSVLILTYNITLKNYLHDRMSEVRENFDWRFFHIENYHQHFNSMLADCNMRVMDVARTKWPKLFEEVEEETPEGEIPHVNLSAEQLEAIYLDDTIFKEHKDAIRKYDVILIDEAQDYREEWVRIIKEYVASENAEIVAFADEKQNVYERKLGEDKFPIIPVATGRWDTSLNTTYRLNTEIAELAVCYQKHFFSNKYVIDEKISPAKQLEFIFDRAHIEYHLLPKKVDGNVICNLAKYLNSVMRAHKLHANDMTVLSSSIDFVRELSDEYGKLTKEKVNCMCETVDEYNKMSISPVKLKETRKFKKQNFWQNTGCVSFSSIHSFKGLETPATVLIVGDGEVASDDGFLKSTIKLVKTKTELAYVGVTRTRNYLFVINLGDDNFDDFFKTKAARRLLSPVVMAVEGEVRNDTF